jgi:hypothetical protein
MRGYREGGQRNQGWPKALPRCGPVPGWASAWRSPKAAGTTHAHTSEGEAALQACTPKTAGAASHHACTLAGAAAGAKRAIRNFSSSLGKLANTRGWMSTAGS